MSTDTSGHDDNGTDDDFDRDLYARLADHYEGELIGDVCEILAQSSSNREANS